MRYIVKRKNKNEAFFELQLKNNAPIFKCLYIKIPDEKINRKMYIELANGERARVDAYRRPFDGILITPDDIFLIETKYGNGQQKRHQKMTERKINNVNPKYFVVRKKEKIKEFKTYSHYIVEQTIGDVKKKWKCETLDELFLFFKEKKYLTENPIKSIKVEKEI